MHVVYSVIVPVVMCNVEYVILCVDVVHLLYIRCCVYIAYAMLGIDDAMYMLDMWCCVYIILCA